MHRLSFIALCGAVLGSQLEAVATETNFRSSGTRTHLVELFTSEGCSSCPPAERSLSELTGSPRLWKDVVPVAFHVDYWDGLGWRDVFASKDFTTRQRAYAAAWGSNSVYTPCFVVSGAEWRGGALNLIPRTAEPAGTLTATVRDDGSLLATYVPHGEPGGRWEIHWATLGLGITSKVKSGENSGRQLTHDFVALSHAKGEMSPTGNGLRFEGRLGATPATPKKALAIWVTKGGSNEPIQATGGLLPNS